MPATGQSQSTCSHKEPKQAWQKPSPCFSTHTAHLPRQPAVQLRIHSMKGCHPEKQCNHPLPIEEIDEKIFPTHHRGKNRKEESLIYDEMSNEREALMLFATLAVEA